MNANTEVDSRLEALFAVRQAAWRAFLANPCAATRAAHTAAREACFSNPSNGL